jgi:hypothetical protein
MGMDLFLLLETEVSGVEGAEVTVDAASRETEDERVGELFGWVVEIASPTAVPHSLTCCP